MKYCAKCGAEMHDEAVVCTKCGCQVSPMESKTDQKVNKAFSGGAMGFLWTILLSLIGLILCCVLGDAKCKKGAVITFVVSIIVGIGSLILLMVMMMNTAKEVVGILG